MTLVFLELVLSLWQTFYSQKFPDVSLETKRVFRFRAGNPAGANGVLMGTLRQRGMKQIGEDWI